MARKMRTKKKTKKVKDRGPALSQLIENAFVAAKDKAERSAMDAAGDPDNYEACKAAFRDVSIKNALEVLYRTATWQMEKP